MPNIIERSNELAVKLETAADALLTEVSTLPADLIAWKPADDVWSVMEILCHVAEFLPFWTGQTLQIVRQPDEPWGRTHTDTARLAAVQRAGARTLADVTAEIRDGARNAAAAIRGLRDGDLAIEAMSRNPRWARQPASFVIEQLLVEHVEKHLGQIRRNATQFQGRG